jgi:hypothetical protein
MKISPRYDFLVLQTRTYYDTTNLSPDPIGENIWPGGVQKYLESA